MSQSKPSTLLPIIIGISCGLAISVNAVGSPPDTRPRWVGMMSMFVITPQPSTMPERHDHSAKMVCCKVGMTLPQDYQQNANLIDADDYPQLPQPTRYQQWIRFNNQYILLNVLTNTVIKIVVISP